MKFLLLGSVLMTLGCGSSDAEKTADTPSEACVAYGARLSALETCSWTPDEAAQYCEDDFEDSDCASREEYYTQMQCLAEADDADGDGLECTGSYPSGNWMILGGGFWSTECDLNEMMCWE